MRANASSTWQPMKAIRATVALLKRRNLCAPSIPTSTCGREVCLEQLTASAPSYAPGFRYLAAIYLRDYQVDASLRPDSASRLTRALQAARRAVELQPESSRGYNTLASILFASHEVEQAFAASDRAVALNNYDMAVLGDYGGRLIAAGELDRGIALLRRGAGIGTLRPAAHHFYLFLGYYLKGDLRNATYEANQLTSKSYPLGLLAWALSAAQNGDHDKALETLNRLVAVQPAWRDDPRGQLDKFFPSTAIVDRLASDLTASGLAATRNNAARPDSILLAPGNGMPTIYIEPFRVTGTPTPRSVTATSLFEKINDAFARFDTINVVLGSRQQVNALDGSSQSMTSYRAARRLSSLRRAGIPGCPDQCAIPVGRCRRGQGRLVAAL